MINFQLMSIGMVMAFATRRTINTLICIHTDTVELLLVLENQVQQWVGLLADGGQGASLLIGHT